MKKKALRLNQFLSFALLLLVLCVPSLAEGWQDSQGRTYNDINSATIPNITIPNIRIDPMYSEPRNTGIAIPNIPNIRIDRMYNDINSATISNMSKDDLLDHIKSFTEGMEKFQSEKTRSDLERMYSPSSPRDDRGKQLVPGYCTNLGTFTLCP
jgi:hypothetical protein